MTKTTGAMDRIIAMAAGITTHSVNHDALSVDRASGRQVASVHAAAKRSLVKITREWHNGLQKQVIFELTEAGLERAIELQELHADPETGIIELTAFLAL